MIKAELEEMRGYIAQEDVDFTGLKEKHQLAIARMLLDCTNLSRLHRVKSGFSFTKAQVREIWGSDATLRAVLRHRFFTVYGGDNLIEQSNCFVPHTYMQRALDKFLSHRTERVASAAAALPMLAARAENTRLARLTIKSRAAPSVDGKQKKAADWSGVNLRPTMPINRDALVHFISTTNNDRHRHVARVLLATATASERSGEIPVSYEQASTGRLFEVHNGLQCVPREVRAAALTGCLDYDISNCHFAIFSQWAKKLGLSAPAVEGYLGNKAQVRARLSAACGAPEEAIKASLIAILYGAPLRARSGNASVPDGAILLALGQRAAPKFVADPEVRAIKDEVSRVGRDLVDSLPTHSGLIGNALGVYVPHGELRASFARLLCHGLQGVESVALRAVLRRCGPSVVLCMHDGWVADRRLDVSSLEDDIFNATGFALSVEEKMISYDQGLAGGDLRAGVRIQSVFLPESEKINKNQGLTCVPDEACATVALLPVPSAALAGDTVTPARGWGTSAGDPEPPWGRRIADERVPFDGNHEEVRSTDVGTLGLTVMPRWNWPPRVSPIEFELEMERRGVWSRLPNP